MKFTQSFVRSQTDIGLCVSADQIKRVRSRFPHLILCPIVVFSFAPSHSQKEQTRTNCSGKVREIEPWSLTPTPPYQRKRGLGAKKLIWPIFLPFQTSSGRPFFVQIFSCCQIELIDYDKNYLSVIQRLQQGVWHFHGLHGQINTSRVLESRKQTSRSESNIPTMLICKTTRTSWQSLLDLRFKCKFFR